LRDGSDHRGWHQPVRLRGGAGASGLLLLSSVSLPVTRLDHRWRAIMATCFFALFGENQPAALVMPPTMLRLMPGQARRTGSRGVC
jgi:hypothetical protein